MSTDQTMRNSFSSGPIAYYRHFLTVSDDPVALLDTNVTNQVIFKERGSAQSPVTRTELGDSIVEPAAPCKHRGSRKRMKARAKLGVSLKCMYFN